MLLVVAALIGTIAFAMLWKELAAKNRPKKLSKLAAGAAAALVSVLLLLTATGRLHWIAAVFAGLLPFVRWAIGLFAGPLIGNWMRGAFFGRQSAAATGASAPPRMSTVATDDLRMTLDHESGEMTGEALTGSLAGQALSALELEAILPWRTELTNADSVQLLDAYLDRRFPDWREPPPQGEAPPPRGSMDAAQALAVLGLEAGASEKEIVAAHRRLMQKLHPDRGGTDYLAATLNQAKAVLTGAQAAT